MSETEKTQLKPCPFCGSDNIRVEGNQSSWVVCMNCDTEIGTEETKKEAINKWNKRYVLGVLGEKKLIERVKKELEGFKCRYCCSSGCDDADYHRAALVEKAIILSFKFGGIVNG